MFFYLSFFNILNITTLRLYFFFLAEIKSIIGHYICAQLSCT